MASKNYYEILGLDKTANLKKIKKAYRKLALQYETDKNHEKGAEEMFKRISEAYFVLADSKKRKAYDKIRKGSSGVSSVKKAGKSSSEFYSKWCFNIKFSRIKRTFNYQGTEFPFSTEDPFKIFEEFFGSRNPFDFDTSKRSSKKNTTSKANVCTPKNRDGSTNQATFKNIDIKLEDVDTGLTKKMRIKSKVHNIPGDPSKYNEMVHVQAVKINPGVMDGTKLTFKKLGNQMPDQKSPSDVVFVIKVNPHQHFTRVGEHGQHLKYMAKIKLIEALCGFSIDIPLLLTQKDPAANIAENHTYSLKVTEIVKSNDEIRIPGRGLPYVTDVDNNNPKKKDSCEDDQGNKNNPSGSAFKRGDIIVVFDVEFPVSLTQEQKNKINFALNNENE